MYLTGTFSVRPFRVSFRNRQFEKDFVVVVDARVFFTINYWFISVVICSRTQASLEFLLSHLHPLLPPWECFAPPFQGFIRRTLPRGGSFYDDGIWVYLSGIHSISSMHPWVVSMTTDVELCAVISTDRRRRVITPTLGLLLAWLEGIVFWDCSLVVRISLKQVIQYYRY